MVVAGEPGAMTVASTLEHFADIAELGEFWPSPDGRSLAYVAGSDGLAALWERSLDDGRAEPRLVWSGQPVQRCVWRPDGARLLVQTNPGGRENYQLIELDPRTGEPGWRTPDDNVRYEIGPAARCGNQPYSPDSTLLAYAANARDHSVFDVLVHDLVNDEAHTVLRGDDRYFPVSFSPDGALLLIHRMRQNTDHDLFVCRVATGEVWHATPHDGPARYLPGAWSADGTGIFLATTVGRDLAGLAYLPVAEPDGLRWLATPEHEVDYVTRAGNQLLWAVNVDGYTTLYRRDLASSAPGQDVPIRCLPPGVCAKDFGRPGYAPLLTGDARTLVCALSSPRAPIELYGVDVATDTAIRWTKGSERLPDPATMVEPEIIRYPSTDDVLVPALLYRPHGAGPEHRAPVVVVIHGGPEVQALPTYDPLVQYLLSRGIGVIEPNYRGSSGYGLAYQRMIYRDFAGGDLRDLAAAADYLSGLDWVDGRRLAVFGVSYGGFATLSCISRQPDKWAAAVEHCGRSDLTSAAVPPHWRNRMREWVGDPVEDADMLRERSPIAHAQHIRIPVLIIHGENDTRVPRSESDRMVQRLRELGKAVEYLILPGDGHTSTNRENTTRALAATADWLISHLLDTARSTG